MRMLTHWRHAARALVCAGWSFGPCCTRSPGRRRCARRGRGGIPSRPCGPCPSPTWTRARLRSAARHRRRRAPTRRRLARSPPIAPMHSKARVYSVYSCRDCRVQKLNARAFTMRDTCGASRPCVPLPCDCSIVNRMQPRDRYFGPPMHALCTGLCMYTGLCMGRGLRMGMGLCMGMGAARPPCLPPFHGRACTDWEPRARVPFSRNRHTRTPTQRTPTQRTATSCHRTPRADPPTCRAAFSMHLCTRARLAGSLRPRSARRRRTLDKQHRRASTKRGTSEQRPRVPIKPPDIDFGA